MNPLPHKASVIAMPRNVRMRPVRSDLGMPEGRAGPEDPPPLKYSSDPVPVREHHGHRVV